MKHLLLLSSIWFLSACSGLAGSSSVDDKFGQRPLTPDYQPKTILPGSVSFTSARGLHQSQPAGAPQLTQVSGTGYSVSGAISPGTISLIGSDQ